MVARALLPIIVLYHNCLVGSVISIRVFLGAQQSTPAVRNALRLNILDTLTKHNLVRLLLSRC
jgi:hypothetical protein